MFDARQRHNSLKTFNPLPTVRKESPPLQTKPSKRLLPTIAENREAQKNQAKELSYNVNRFQSVLSRANSDTTPEEIVRQALTVVRSFGEVDNNFREVFVGLHNQLKPFLFLNESQLASRYRLREGLSYRKACHLIDKQHLDVVAQRDERIRLLLEDVDKQREMAQRARVGLEHEIVFLKSEVERYKQMANVEYVLALELKVRDQKQAISNQQEEYRILAKKNEEASLEIEQLRGEVNDLQGSCAQLEDKVYDLNVVKEKTELYLLNLKDRFDELMSRMIGISEVIRKVQHENQVLVAQRVKLVNRAAVSFQALTPRLKYESIFLMDSSTYLRPSNEIMRDLIENFQGDRNEMFQKYFISKKNRKLQQCEAIREKTVDEIIKAKKDLHKFI